MPRIATLALAVVLCLPLAAQNRSGSKNGGSRDDLFPSISKDQTRGTKDHRAHVLCETSCAGPKLVCHYSECFDNTHPVYCTLSVPYDGGCTCQPCTP